MLNQPHYFALALDSSELYESELSMVSQIREEFQSVFEATLACEPEYGQTMGGLRESVRTLRRSSLLLALGCPGFFWPVDVSLCYTPYYPPSQMSPTTIFTSFSYMNTSMEFRPVSILLTIAAPLGPNFVMIQVPNDHPLGPRSPPVPNKQQSIPPPPKFSSLPSLTLPS